MLFIIFLKFVCGFLGAFGDISVIIIIYYV